MMILLLQKQKIKNESMLSFKKAIISFAGPFVNFIMIIVIIAYYQITKNTEMINIPIDLLIYSNLLILLFNLIPIYPLDGGRILKEILHINYGIYMSYIITNKVSNITVIILTVVSSFAILAYKNIAILIIIAYLWTLVYVENKRYNLKINILKKIKFAN